MDKKERAKLYARIRYTYVLKGDNLFKKYKIQPPIQCEELKVLGWTCKTKEVKEFLHSKGNTIFFYGNKELKSDTYWLRYKEERKKWTATVYSNKKQIQIGSYARKRDALKRCKTYLNKDGAVIHTHCYLCGGRLPDDEIKMQTATHLKCFELHIQECRANDPNTDNIDNTYDTDTIDEY